MENILPKQTVKFVWLLAIAVVASIGITARAGDKGAFKGSSPDRASQKTDEVTNWGPSTTIQNISYNGLPISEVANNLKEIFKSQFDILVPTDGQAYDSYPITLELKDVTAAEIFNAMNMMFESGHRPLHWDLISNGHRPTALLRTLTSDLPTIDPNTGLPTSLIRPPEKPMVFFIGDLLGERADGFMTMSDVLSTMTDLCRSANVTASISGHEQAELLVARGTDSDLKFVQDTLTALRQKVQLDRLHKAQDKSEKAKTNGTNKP